MTPASRLAASLELLDEIGAAGARPADAVANTFFRARRYIGAGDRRAVSDRVWGVLRTRRRLSWWLDRLGGAPTPRLLIAAALHFDGWAGSAIAESFSGGRYGAAPLDGAERAVVARLAGHTLLHPEMPDAVRLELPDWLFPALQERFGSGLENEMTALLGAAPLDLRVNLLKAAREEAAAALRGEGITTVPTPLSPWGLRAAGRQNVTATAPFRSGHVEIQDEGSQLIAALVGAGPDMRVADWCAGAGGKTLAMAAMMGNRGRIAACDVHDKRLAASAERFRRAGVHNVETHLAASGDKWVKRRAGTFDRVLVDAPCTGTGTWRRNPDARHRLREADLAELLPKQAAILAEAQRLVKAGGRLIYSTCSLLPAENERQVEAFCRAHPDFAVVTLAEAWPDRPAALGDGAAMQLTPRSHGTDGFFAAVLVRRGGPPA